MLYPETIGVQKMDWRTECRSWFLKYVLAGKRGDSRAAKEALAKIRGKDEVEKWWSSGNFTAYYFASEKFMYYTLALSLTGKRRRAELLLKKLLVECKKDFQRTLFWVTYLEGWHFLEIEKKALASRKMLSGFTLPRAQYEFAAAIAELINKSKYAK